MTIGGWIGLEIGLLIGYFAGMIISGIIVDRYWKKRIKKIEHDLRNAHKAPYEMEPGKKYLIDTEYHM